MAQRDKLIDADLEEQVAALRKELGALTRAFGRRGANLYEGASDKMSEYLTDFSEYLPSMRSIRGRARVAGRMAYDHPAVVAAVGLLVVGLVASLLVRPRIASHPKRNTANARESAKRDGKRRR